MEVYRYYAHALSPLDGTFNNLWLPMLQPLHSISYCFLLILIIVADLESHNVFVTLYPH